MPTQPFRRERWSMTANATSAIATLNGAVLAAATTITVNNASVFPTKGNYDVIINNSEIATVRSVSANTLTLTAGLASGHGDGSNVVLVLTSNALDRAISDAGGKFLYPFNRILNGATTLTESSFTWFNQGTAAAVDADNGGLRLTLPNEAHHNIRGKYISAPSTPWTVTCYVELAEGHADHTDNGGTYGGILARESTSNKLYMLAITGNRLVMWKMDTYNTFNAAVDSINLENIGYGAWFQMQDDGTTVKGKVSLNGYDFFEIWNEARTTFMSGGINQIGFGGSSGVNTTGNLPVLAVKSWIVE